MVTAVKRPAGETRGKVAAGPDAGQCHRASSRPYSNFHTIIWSENQTSAGVPVTKLGDPSQARGSASGAGCVARR